MKVPWEDLQLLLAVLEEGSFSAAARRLSLTQPTVSRRVAALEQRLGRSLFRRDVEGAHLTEQAAQLLPPLEQMARWAAEAARIADAFDERPAGDVRIAAPPGTAFELLVPLAARLRGRLPEIRLHLIAGVERVDLSRGTADLAIRSAAPSQPDLEVALHGRIGMAVLASRDYAARLAPGRSVADLDWVAWAYPNEHLEPNPTLSRLVPGFRPAFASNDFVVQLRAVSLGLGAMVLPRAYHPGQPFERFVELPVGLPLPDLDFYLVCAKTARWVPRVRAVVAELSLLLRSVEGVSEVSDRPLPTSRGAG